MNSQKDKTLDFNFNEKKMDELESELKELFLFLEDIFYDEIKSMDLFQQEIPMTDLPSK